MFKRTLTRIKAILLIIRYRRFYLYVPVGDDMHFIIHGISEEDADEIVDDIDTQFPDESEMESVFDDPEFYN